MLGIRERINPIVGWGMIAFTVFCSLLSLALSIVGDVTPVIGYAACAADFALSILVFMVLGTWTMTLNTGIDRLLVRLGWILGLLLTDMLLSPLPYIGTVVDFLVLFAVPVRLYLFMKKVQHEDEEYNTKMKEQLASAVRGVRRFGSTT